MKRILVIGSLNMDYVLEVEAMPQVGETVLSKSFSQNPGGKGANQAYTVGKLGGQAAMLGAVGADEDGAVLCGNLESVGVDASRILRCPQAATGRAFIYVDSEGNNSIVAAQGANSQVDRGYIDANLDLLEESGLVVLQLEIPLDTVVYAAKKAKAMGKTVILDPAPARPGLPPELFACVDYLKPNETELATLAGLDRAPETPAQLRGAAEALLAQGVGTVVATLGEKGAFLAEASGRVENFPPLRGIQAVDTTAAGDSFTAALALSLSQGKEIGEAVELAVRVSGITVTRRGAQSSIPDLAEVQAARA